MSTSKIEVGDRVKFKPPWNGSTHGKIIQKRILFTIELDKADFSTGRKTTYVAYESEVEPE